MISKLLLGMITIVLIAQIPAPNDDDTIFGVADIQDRRANGQTCKYKIQPFLQVAHSLQKMDEQDRSNQLSESAKLDSLGEPTIILCRLLIENSDGTPLRRPLLGAPASIINESSFEHPDGPISYFENVPFFVVHGYALGGRPEHATSYLDNAVRNGRWRQHKFQTVPEAKLNAIAERFIITHENKTSVSKEWLSEFVKSQLGPPKPAGKNAR